MHSSPSFMLRCYSCVEWLSVELPNHTNRYSPKKLTHLSRNIKSAYVVVDLAGFVAVSQSTSMMLSLQSIITRPLTRSRIKVNLCYVICILKHSEIIRRLLCSDPQQITKLISRYGNYCVVNRVPLPLLACLLYCNTFLPFRTRYDKLLSN